MEIIKLSENKIMVKIVVPVMDFDKDNSTIKMIDTTILKIRYRIKTTDGNKFFPILGTKSNPTRGLSRKYATKMEKIKISFLNKTIIEHCGVEYDVYLPNEVLFMWDDGDRRRRRNNKIEELLKNI